MFSLLLISIVFPPPPPPPHFIVFYPSPTRFIFFLCPRDSIKDCQLPSLVHFEAVSRVVRLSWPEKIRVIFAVHYNYFEDLRQLVLFSILFKAIHTSRRDGLVSSCLSAEHAIADTSASAGFRFASCFGELSLLEELLSSFLLLVLPIAAKFRFKWYYKEKKKPLAPRSSF